MLVEVFCIIRAISETRREKRESDEKIAEANERAAKADLARAELEDELRLRETTQSQYDFIKGLSERYKEVNIGYEVDAETHWFATKLRDAFWNAGIRCATCPRAPHHPSVSCYDGLTG